MEKDEVFNAINALAAKVISRLNIVQKNYSKLSSKSTFIIDVSLPKNCTT